MTNTEKILATLKNFPSGLDDRQLSEKTGVKPVPQVNQICRRLAKEGLVVREDGREGTILNFLKPDRPHAVKKTSLTVNGNGQMEMDRCLEDFIEALKLAGIAISPEKIEVRYLGCPHKVTSLPKGKMAVYVFSHSDVCLKVGKVGAKSGPRFTYQHYNPASSRSNLAKSLLNDPKGPCGDLTGMKLAEWMKEHLNRTDILLDDTLGLRVLSFLEAFLHCRLGPKYEGAPEGA